jgi:hypothetical protein
MRRPERLGLRAVDLQHADPRALGQEALDDRTTETRPRPRDQRDGVVEPAHVRRSC